MNIAARACARELKPIAQRLIDRAWVSLGCKVALNSDV
jgi:hypothetical protein